MVKEIREWKSNSFSLLMHEKKYALETYNVLNNTNYENPEDVEVVEVDGGYSLSVRNDATFIIDSVVNLYEHQSTVNPNMPLRLLFYISKVYRDLLDDPRKLFLRQPIMLPTPRFVVFYNGTQKCIERETLRLSDSFIQKDESPWLELTCEMVNINPGYNENIKSKCVGLSGYMSYVEKTRKYLATMEQRDAISLAIDECVQEGILSDFFTRYKAMIISADAIDATHESLMEFVIQDAQRKIESIVADKDAEIADKDAEIADKDAEIADKNAEIANKDTEIARLKAKLGEK